MVEHYTTKTKQRYPESELQCVVFPKWNKITLSTRPPFLPIPVRCICPSQYPDWVLTYAGQAVTLTQASRDHICRSWILLSRALPRFLCWLLSSGLSSLLPGISQTPMLQFWSSFKSSAAYWFWLPTDLCSAESTQVRYHPLPVPIIYQSSVPNPPVGKRVKDHYTIHSCPKYRMHPPYFRDLFIFILCTWMFSLCACICTTF